MLITPAGSCVGPATLVCYPTFQALPSAAFSAGCILSGFSFPAEGRGRLRQPLGLAFYWVTPDLGAGEWNVPYVD